MTEETETGLTSCSVTAASRVGKRANQSFVGRSQRDGDWKTAVKMVTAVGKMDAALQVIAR